MPYSRHDQLGGNGDHSDGCQRHDAYPVDMCTLVSVNGFDFDYIEASGATPPCDGDGFDLYRIANGYAARRGTRDGDCSRSSSAGVQAIRRLDLLSNKFSQVITSWRRWPWYFSRSKGFIGSKTASRGTFRRASPSGRTQLLRAAQFLETFDLRA